MKDRQTRRLEWKKSWKEEDFEGETRAERRRNWRNSWNSETKE